VSRLIPRGLRDSRPADEPDVREAMTTGRVLVVAQRLKNVVHRDRVVAVPLGPRTGETRESPIPGRLLARLTTTDPAAGPNANALAANGGDRLGLVHRPQMDARPVGIRAADPEGRDQNEARRFEMSSHAPRVCRPSAQSLPRASRAARVRVLAPAVMPSSEYNTATASAAGLMSLGSS
jgi:hypothetical protein